MMAKKGTKYACGECGLVLVVDEPCGCEPACVPVCCEKPMKEVKAKPKK
jgi:hypothetical protein